MLNRRDFMRAALMSTLLPGVVNRVAFAAAPGDARFVFVILRGAMDGLAAVPAYGDDQYAAARGALALSPPGAKDGVLRMDDLFGLHPAFKSLHEMYGAGELLVAHAAATPYRSRSHFDGQKLLENGTTDPLGARDGWLNRALSFLPGTPGHHAAISLSQTVPLVLYGKEPVSSWAPTVFPDMDMLTLQRIAQIYEGDPFFAEQFHTALETRQMADDIDTKKTSAMGSPGKIGQLPVMTEAAATFLTDPNGPRIAVLEISGWDTHANQGTTHGHLASQFKGLDRGLQKLKIHMKDAWKDTTVVLTSEFGRMVAVNGTRGTDHGTAGVVIVAGGAVNGGRVLADWPGLARNQLYQARDLYPTLDSRSVFKSVLHERLQIPKSALESKIFPDSGGCPLIQDLFRVTA